MNGRKRLVAALAACALLVPALATTVRQAIAQDDDRPDRVERLTLLAEDALERDLSHRALLYALTAATLAPDDDRARAALGRVADDPLAFISPGPVGGGGGGADLPIDVDNWLSRQQRELERLQRSVESLERDLDDRGRAETRVERLDNEVRNLEREMQSLQRDVDRLRREVDRIR